MPVIRRGGFRGWGGKGGRSKKARPNSNSDVRRAHSNKSVVLNLGSIKPQGYGESVSGLRRQEILSNKSEEKK